MPSSISNSNAARRGLRGLAIGVVTLLLIAEALVRVAVPWINSTQKRFNRELAAAQSISAAPVQGKARLLIIGNSLSLTDLDLDLLNARTDGKFLTRRWAIDDTHQLDWYYGLRRLFRAGARPDVVVVGGKGNHFNSSQYRGYFFAHYILDLRDLPSLIRETRLGFTPASNLLFAKGSALMGSHEQIYSRVVGSIIPGFERLSRLLSRATARVEVPAQAVGTPSLEPFQRLDALCRSYGARLVIWVPPTPYQDAQASLFETASITTNRLTVLHPVLDGAFPASDYADGFHLNPEGAKKFTERFAVELLRWWEQKPSAALSPSP